jgi:class 3 adenylate cyclase
MHTAAMVDGVDTLYTRVDDCAIAYQVHGAGVVDLLLIDGWIRCVELDWDDPGYARLLRADGRFSRVIRYDGRGSGMSDGDPTDSGPVLDAWVRDAVGVLDALGVTRCAVFGLGLGSPVAIHLAALHRDRVRALVLSNSFARLRAAPDHSYGLAPEAIDAALDAIRVRWGRGVMLDLYGAGHDAEAQTRMARYERLAATPNTAVQLMTALADVDVRADLSAIEAPTLVIHRENPVLDIAHGREVATAIPGAVFEGQPADAWAWRRETDEYRDLARITEFLTGARHDADSIRSFAAILFTDIVGSTSTAAALGDRKWSLLLDAHDAETQRQVDRAGGRLVTSTGDGVLAIFSSPSQALECAIAVREALAHHHIGVRTAVHAAEIELRDDNVGGIGIHIAARINSIAEAGQILVSSTVTELVTGSGYEFADEGTHKLEGVPTSWNLWSLND